MSEPQVPAVHPLHTKVPGRARYRVAGLNGSSMLKRHLERELGRVQGVLQVSASTVTGNVLVRFNGRNDAAGIAGLIHTCLPVNGGSMAAPSATAPPDRGARASRRKARQAAARLRHTITQRLGPPEEPPQKRWHTLGATRALAVVDTPPATGLTAAVSARRLARYGPNTLPEADKRPGWRIILDQFNSLPVYLLGAAAGVSLLTGGVLDAVVVAGVVAANAVIGVVTETKAEKTIDSLKTFVHPTAEVLRGGKTHRIAVEDVVPGDIVLLKPGTYVPADCRLIASNHLSIDESMLTGESMPVAKHKRVLRDKHLPLAERVNMAYMGTLVTGGQGKAVVVATGRLTEIGLLQTLLTETQSPETPIERQLRIMGDQLVKLCGIVCGLVFIMGFLRGYGLLPMLRMAISLAAAAVPEGLPAAATINFALGINRMRQHRVLIRQLQAVETIGAIQTVCLDKTGTLTHNRMTVTAVCLGQTEMTVQDGAFTTDGRAIAPERREELRRLLEVSVLCSETKVNGSDADNAPRLYGSSTENALIDMAWRAGLDIRATRRRHPLLRLNHRSENRLFMSTLHQRSGGGRLLTLKGSPPEVLAMCSSVMIEGAAVPLSEALARRIEDQNTRLAGDSLRVLGMAFKELGPDDPEDGQDRLTWLGLVGMADPVREGVAELIGVFHRAGIRTVMITGDQNNTAYAVARELNMSGRAPLEILDSSELTAVAPATLNALAQKVHAYSRVSPAHKLRIVQALQGAGRTVAMTGDGINDGPALKAADIGIAMGESGTDVAREVADVVLKDDNLEALITAVADGRATYDNIRKSVHFFLATNLSEIMVMFASMALGLGFPLTVMQLLWINIISDIFPGLALSAEAPEPGIMQRPPRDGGKNLFSGGDFKRMTFESAMISAGAMGAYTYGLARYGAGLRATGLAFQGLTFAQLLHAISCRSEDKRVFDDERLPPNRYLTWAVGGSLLLQALTLVVPPLRGLLGVSALSAADALVIGSAASLPLIVNEATKRTTGGVD